MGALESNAGDEFHFWWAASRALALIKPGADSRLLVVERLSRVDDPDDEYEAVDVSEYFGGDDFDSATRLIVSQLKYSTRHPDQPWTAARLCRQRARRRADGSVGVARSVIADLAGTFVRLVAGHGCDAVVSKVRIRLVSNQPGDSLLVASITAASKWSRAKGAAGQRAAMLRALTGEHAVVIRALADAVGTRLRSGEFCRFLTVLDLSQTGALDRAALARSVRAGASKLAPGRGPDSARRLFDLVRREALPESGGYGLRAADVLAQLGVADPLDLYPAPPQLPNVRNPLPAPGARAVAKEALAHLGGVIVAHEQAGAGKTTAMLQVADHLPAGSAVVLFDCYGGGDYLSSGEERHTPQRFVTQTVNDLAQRCGTSLLVQPPQVEGDLWRLLARTLSRAVDTLDPGAVLILIVDAADNAAVAMSARGDRGFLPGLVGLRLPARVAVVLTARSHRVKSLGAASANRVEVVPFDQETSAAHLRRHRPAASHADADEFHTRTGGNPRAQFYALDQADKAGWDMPTLLEACARTPEMLFDDIVNSALQVSGADAGGQRWLALMVALARPVSTATLAAALGVDLAAVDAFAAGLAPGVNVVDGAIQFRDENFETYVRDRVDPADVVVAHDRLADMFLAARAGDADAAAHVADHLFHANRLDELLRLLLDEDSPRGIADGFRREQVQGQRLDLAARAAAATGSAAVAVRIAARGCDTASRLDTLSRLVESQLDLVARYADVDLLRAYALRHRRREWLAPVQMRLAAALARDPERHAAARAALDSAQAWLRRWMAGRENKTRHWQLDADDVASAAEARYRLDGVDAAIAELRRWRPAQFALDAAAALAARVAAEIGPDAVRDMLRARHVPTAAQAAFLAYAASPEADPDQGWVNEVLAALITVDVGEPRRWQARVLDTALRHGDRQAAAALAQHWARELPRDRGAFSSGDSDGTTALRCHAAAALDGRDLDVDALVPTSLRPKEPVNGHADDPRARDRGEWMATVRPLAAVAVLAVCAAAGDAVEQAVVALVDAGLADRTAKAGHRWFTYDVSYHAWAQLAVSAVVDAAAPVDLLDRLASAAPALLGDGAPALWLDLAKALAGHSAHTGRAADLCLRAAAQVRSNAYPASDRLELLARAAESAGSVAPAVGRRLFDQAVDAATGINDDAARLLAVHADLASRATIAPQDRTGVAARLARVAEDVALHVSESGVVPYAAVAGAVARLDAEVGLAAASRWDDEDRIRLLSTLPAALVGAIDGGGVAAQEALAFDHLIEEDGARLNYQLAVIDRLPGGAAGTAAARLALSRAAEWLRCHVAARLQPTFARRLLDGAAARGLDGHLRAKLDPICALGPGKGDGTESQPLIRWGATEPPPAAQALLGEPSRRGWARFENDVTVLTDAHVHGDEMRSFVAAVACSAPPNERLDALAAVAALPNRHGADIVLPVLATSVRQWCDWPGVSDWAANALPRLLAQYLPDLAWRQDSGPLLSDLRAFADDHAIRRAVLLALPEARLRLTANGWQNIAALLGRLCDAADAADALDGLLADRANDVDRDRAIAVSAPGPDPIPLLLWSAFGHPRREVRWRATHAARELLTNPNSAETAPLTAKLVDCLDRKDAGAFRDPALHFYHLSAAAALLVALHRVAIDQPDLLTPHLPALTRHATSHTLPHAQIRQLARDAALAVAAPGDPAIDLLRHANQPTRCHTDRKRRSGDSDRHVSDQRRYDFDLMDTIPYWYAPLARVFDVPVDTIAEHAEPWIIDRWGHSQDDWWTDTRELRDQRSWERTSHRHGSIPSDENLRLYLEYHAMMAAAGELVDAGQPLHVDSFDDSDPWQDWLAPHLPSPGQWLVDLRVPVPPEADLFGDLPPLDEWDIPAPIDHDRELGLVDGGLPGAVLVTGYTSLRRHGARSTTCIHSALVAPDHAADLQRALAAAANPTDWKLPDEDDDEFEVNYGRFVLRGWLTDPRDYRDRIEEHDRYARGLRTALPLPGRRFRSATGAAPNPTGLILLAHNGAVIARAEQWADPDSETAVASSGNRVYVDRAALLHYLATTGCSLILEVQIGRHRSNTDPGNYQLPHSRIYLVDATGHVTGR